MPYGEILATAAKLIWKFKVLWLFGLLASCGAVTNHFGTSFNTDFTSSDFSKLQEQLPRWNGQEFIARSGQLGEMLIYNWRVLLIVFCILGLITFLIGIFGRTGMTLGVWVGDSGAQQLDSGQLANATQRSFWRVMGATLLAGLPSYFVALLFIIVWAASTVGVAAQWLPALNSVFACLTVPLGCAMLPLLYVLGILGELATAAVVGENGGVWRGFTRGWGMFRRHAGPVILMGLLVLVLQLIVGALAGLAFAPMGTNFILGGINLLLTNSVDWELSGQKILFGVLLIPFIWIVSAIFNAYIGAVWVLVFRRLAAAEHYAAMASYAPPPPMPPVYPGQRPY